MVIVNKKRKILYTILIVAILCFCSFYYYINYFHYMGRIVTEHGLYTGEFRGMQFNGFGKFDFSNGVIYEGQWKGNIMEGYGKMTFVDGSKYEGEFKEGYMSGNGKMTTSNGTVKIGEWDKGKYISN